MTERDLPSLPDADNEVPEEDALEQRTAAVEGMTDEEPVETSDEADPADVAEQARIVELDDDEYR